MKNERFEFGRIMGISGAGQVCCLMYAYDPSMGHDTNSIQCLICARSNTDLSIGRPVLGISYLP